MSFINVDKCINETNVHSILLLIWQPYHVGYWIEIYLFIFVTEDYMDQNRCIIDTINFQKSTYIHANNIYG